MLYYKIPSITYDSVGLEVYQADLAFPLGQCAYLGQPAVFVPWLSAGHSVDLLLVPSPPSEQWPAKIKTQCWYSI